MGDALRALIDAVGLEVGSGAEIRSDDDRWTLDIDPDGTHAWVATRHRPTWHEALFADTGVVVGSATLGPLAAEALALPPVATTQPAGFPSADVVLALRHIGHLDGGRWHGVQQDALARLVVTTVLHDNPPPLLRDNSLARILDRLFDPPGGHSTADLLDGVRMSPRTLERRCAETTGCTPAQLGRWFRSLAVRSALARGDRPAEVAARFGFSTTASMRRALQRVRAPETDTPRWF